MIDSSMRGSTARNYKLGVLYSILAAVLLGVQNPFSATAAKTLGGAEFVCITQLALLFSVPLMLLSSTTRRDFRSLAVATNIGKFFVLFIIGLAGLVLYNVGLSGAHPIMIAAILNLSPFWAALVALVVSGRPIPISPSVFFGCLSVAFVGAMMIAWSQTPENGDSSMQALGSAVLHGTWIFAVPVPIFYALSGTLVRKWFVEFEESASVALMFVLSSALLIPGTLYLMRLRSESLIDARGVPAMVLLLIGTLISAAVGRVVYQMALSATDNDNGFVSMFLLFVPAIACLLSIPMSWWIPDLKFAADPSFFMGLGLIAAPLAVFSIQSARESAANPEESD